MDFFRDGKLEGGNEGEKNINFHPEYQEWQLRLHDVFSPLLADTRLVRLFGQTPRSRNRRRRCRAPSNRKSIRFPGTTIPRIDSSTASRSRVRMCARRSGESSRKKNHGKYSERKREERSSGAMVGSGAYGMDLQALPMAQRNEILAWRSNERGVLVMTDGA